jgi:hypothetical protein
MLPQRDFVAGDPVPGPDFWREVVAMVNASQIKVTPPLYKSRRQGGNTSLTLKPPLTMTGVVTAIGNPYTFQEAWWQGGAFVPNPDGRTIQAYPYNPADSLEIGGPGYLQYKSRADEWRFEVIRDGAATITSPPPPAPPVGCCPSRPPPATLHISCKYGSFPMGLRQLPAPFGTMTISTDPANPDTWWSTGVLTVFDPLTLVKHAPCPNFAAPLNLPEGGLTHVAYLVQCTPNDYFNPFLQRQVTGFNFWVAKFIASGQDQLTNCGSPPSTSSESWPWPAATAGGGNIVTGVLASNPCHISISQALIDTLNPGVPDFWWKTHGAPETVVISE